MANLSSPSLAVVTVVTYGAGSDEKRRHGDLSVSVNMRLLSIVVIVKECTLFDYLHTFISVVKEASHFHNALDECHVMLFPINAFHNVDIHNVVLFLFKRLIH